MASWLSRESTFWARRFTGCFRDFLSGTAVFMADWRRCSQPIALHVGGIYSKHKIVQRRRNPPRRKLTLYYRLTVPRRKREYHFTNIIMTTTGAPGLKQHAVACSEQYNSQVYNIMAKSTALYRSAARAAWKSLVSIGLIGHPDNKMINNYIHKCHTQRRMTTWSSSKLIKLISARDFQLNTKMTCQRGPDSGLKIGRNIYGSKAWSSTALIDMDKLQNSNCLGQKDYITTKWFVQLKLTTSIHMDTIRQQQMFYTIGHSLVFPQQQLYRFQGNDHCVETG